jgi:hypothetical protein
VPDDSQVLIRSEEMSEQERLRLDAELTKLSTASDKLWKARADGKDWDAVVADLSVYRLSGVSVSEDPRRKEDYRDQVVEGLGFGTGWKEKKPYLSEADIAAVREVVRRKAAGFWLEGTPRTTIRHVAHDTVPTGPPVCTPPHNLGHEAAQWVDEKLEAEVAR